VLGGILLQPSGLNRYYKRINDIINYFKTHDLSD